jgi:hypothetical protein
MCWFDYIGMSPEYKRAHFVEAYSTAYRGQYARRVDSSIAGFINPIPGMRFNDPETLIDKKTKYNAINRAVRAADSISVPYPFYCSTALEKGAKDNWTHLPRIEQIAAKALVEHVKESWDQHLLNVVELPEPKSVESYGVQFVAYLHRLVSLRERPAYLVRLLLNKGYITDDGASLLFGADVTKQAKRLVYAESV